MVGGSDALFKLFVDAADAAAVVVAFVVVL